MTCITCEETVVLGSGNLGLMYLMEEKRRLTLLYPARLPRPAEAIVGAEAAHRVLVGWRRQLRGDPAP